MKKDISAEQIDALLPQTQCGLCNYPGCMPYAQALATNLAPINLCPPGGVPGLIALANLLEQDATPYLAEMQDKTKPKSAVVIREAECIGCTKCIQACPVDAILGGAKLMHTVIRSECTGCDLCIPACPVDCIDITSPAEERENSAAWYRKRFQARELRLKQDKQKFSASLQNKTLEIPTKDYIQAALSRVKNKKCL